MARLIATWFGVGRLPKAPGTWGSLAALFLGVPILLQPHGAALLLTGSLIVFAVGIWAARTYAQSIGVKDPKEVVVDEVAGQWLALTVANPYDPLTLILAFALFRLFDILKPWPISVLDRRLPGGLGIMADDMAAGGVAALALYGVRHVLA
ncbi:MAG: phosphatidylglycerophosphatase A [Proteobacteria bacterium]|nr:MAG: phosphatidylglycerophosphatase A [Pseudomonadota bacterium]